MIRYQADGAGGGSAESPGQKEVTFPGWMPQLPDEFKKNETLARFDGKVAGVPLSLVKGYVDLSAQHEALKAEHEKIRGAYDSSRPPEQYELEEVPIPEDVKLEGLDELKTDFLATAKKHGLSGAQAKGLWKDAVENTIGELREQAESAKVAETESAAALKAKAAEVEKILKEGDGKEFKGWGANYEAEMGLVKDAIRRFGPEKFQNVFELEMKDGTRLGNNLDFVMTLHEIGKRTADDREISGAPVGGGNGEKTPEQRAAEMYPDTPSTRMEGAMDDNGLPEWAKEIYGSTTGR